MQAVQAQRPPAGTDSTVPVAERDRTRVAASEAVAAADNSPAVGTLDIGSLDSDMYRY